MANGSIFTPEMQARLDLIGEASGFNASTSNAALNRADRWGTGDAFRQNTLVETQPRHSPNWNRLTPTEQGVMAAMPGIANSKPVEFISSVNDTRFGNWLFRTLDLGAVLIERVAGTVYQTYQDPNLGVSDFFNPAGQAKYRAAWKASDAFYETIAPPLQFGKIEGGPKGLAIGRQWFGKPEEEWTTEESAAYSEYEGIIQRKEEHWKAFFDGDTIPDVGGLPMLIAMRQRILAGDNVETVLEEHRASLGALAIRSQIFDTIGHVLLDPAPFILGKIKPIQRLHGLRQLVQTERAAPEITHALSTLQDLSKGIDSTQDVNKLADDLAAIGRNIDPQIDELSKIANNLSDAVRARGSVKGGGLTQEAQDLLRKVDDGGVPAFITKNMRRIAEENGVKVTKNMKPADVVEAIRKSSGPDVSKSTKGIDDAIAAVEDLAKRTEHFQDLGWHENLLFTLTGGSAMDVGKIKQTLLDTPVLGQVAKFFTLTPRARVSEFNATMINQFRLIMRGIDMTPENFGVLTNKIAGGFFDTNLGHMLVSPIGRHFQGVMQGFRHVTNSLLGSWTDTANSRLLLQRLAKTMDVDSGALLSRIWNGGSSETNGILKQLDDLVRQGKQDEILQAFAAGEIKQADIIALGEVFRARKNMGIIPHDSDSFMAAVEIEFARITGELGIAKFGIKERNLMSKWEGALREAQSLVLLGAGNFIYPIQNLWNNEFTMVGRGIGGMFRRTPFVRKFFKDEVGVLPSRLEEAFTLAGSGAEGVVGKSGETLQVANKLFNDLRDGTGLFRKYRDFIRKAPRGTRSWALKFEQWARARGNYTAYTNSWPNIWHPTRLNEHRLGLADDLARVIGPDAAAQLEAKVQNALSVKEIDQLATAENLAYSAEMVFGNAAKRMGLPQSSIQEALGGPMMQDIRRSINNLGEFPKPDDINRVIADMDSAISRSVRDSLVETLPVITAETAERVGKAGSTGVADVVSDMMYYIDARHISHIKRVDSAFDDIVSLTDAAEIDRRVNKLLADSDVAWGNTWDTIGAYRKGLKEGTELPKNVNSSIASLRTNSSSFIRKRNSLWRGYADDIRSGKFTEAGSRGARARTIQELLDADYLKYINKTNGAQRTIDNFAIQSIADPIMGRNVQAGRATTRLMRRNYMLGVLEHRRSIRGMDATTKARVWQRYNQDKVREFSKIQMVEYMQQAMMRGERAPTEFFQRQADLIGSKAYDDLAKGVDDVADVGKVVSADEQIALDTYRRWRGMMQQRGASEGVAVEGVAKAKKELDAALKQAKLTQKEVAALQEGLIRKADDVADVGKAAGVDDVGKVDDLLKGVDELVDTKPAITNFDQYIKPQLKLGLGEDELWFGRQQEIVELMRQEALSLAQEPSFKFADLPTNLQDEMGAYTRLLRGEIVDAQNNTFRVAEGWTDAALLNYGRTYGFDDTLSLFAPFEFWFTHSVLRWGLHSIDRPAMLATYMKLNEALGDVVGENEGFPQRLRGRIKIPMPFLPPQMEGGLWVDPMRSFGIPFERFFDAPISYMNNLTSVEGRMERKLSELLESGQIDQASYERAVAGENPQLLDRVRGLVLEDDDNLKFDVSDFMSLSISPHMPIQMAWNIARGTPEKLSPLPATRLVKNILTAAGAPPGVYDNIWGNVRKSMGLPAFDEWYEYSIERALSNMAAEGLIDPQVALRVQIEKKGPEWEAAQARVDKQKRTQFLFSATLQLPVQPYPEGERRLREMYDDFYSALDKNEAGDPTPLRDFFDQNPEFETRLALWKNPEERMVSFLVDNIWNTYFDLNKLDQREVVSQLGDEFKDNFLDKEGRLDYNEFPIELLAVWLKVMGGDPPGTLGKDALPIQKAPPKVGFVAQFFFDYRQQRYPNWFEEQNKYYAIDEDSRAARREWRDSHPDLVDYWDWRREFLKGNPTVVPYISDSFEPNFESVAELEEAFANEPNVGAEAISGLIGQDVSNLIMDNVLFGTPLPSVAERRVNSIAERFNLSPAQVMQIIANSAAQNQPALAGQ